MPIPAEHYERMKKIVHEDEEAREAAERQKRAQRMAAMGGVNPFGAGVPSMKRTGSVRGPPGGGAAPFNPMAGMDPKQLIAGLKKGGSVRMPHAQPKKVSSDGSGTSNPNFLSQLKKRQDEKASPKTEDKAEETGSAVPHFPVQLKSRGAATVAARAGPVPMPNASELFSKLQKRKERSEGGSSSESSPAGTPKKEDEEDKPAENPFLKGLRKTSGPVKKESPKEPEVPAWKRELEERKRRAAQS